MAPLESILIKMSTLTSNWEQSWCNTQLTLYLMSTNKSFKKNSTTLLSLVSLNHTGPLNGHPRPLLSLRRMGAFDKLLLYSHSIKLSFANNTIYLSLRTCLTTALATNSSLNLTFPCNTTHLNLMNQAKSSVSFHTLWQIQIQTSPHGLQMCTRHCPASYEGSFSQCQQHQCLPLWYWCFFFHLGSPHFTSWQNTILVGSQRLHHQSAQMQMGHAGNWLALLLAHTHWFEALVQKIDGILQMQKPKNLLQMRGFLHVVNHYCLMWPQCAHI